MPAFQISLMEINNIRESARVLSAAMVDNPVHEAVFGGQGETERREIEAMFFELLRDAPGIIFLVKEEEKIIGVMRMKSCLGGKAPPAPKGPKDENDIRWRKHEWQAEWALRDPSTLHWHLGPIGVLPSHQGLGVGSMLMKRFCREVDACRAEAYLETDLDKNVRFYLKFGFTLTAESEVLGIKNRFMVRAPKA